MLRWSCESNAGRHPKNSRGGRDIVRDAGEAIVSS